MWLIWYKDRFAHQGLHDEEFARHRLRKETLEEKFTAFAPLGWSYRYTIHFSGDVETS